MDEPNDNTPATRGDLKRAEDRLEQLLAGDLRRLEDRLIEVYRDGETKLLQAFYAFAQTNQNRMAAVETEAEGIKRRIATVEERMLQLERKVNFPNHPAS